MKDKKSENKVHKKSGVILKSPNWMENAKAEIEGMTQNNICNDEKITLDDVNQRLVVIEDKLDTMMTNIMNEFQSIRNCTRKQGKRVKKANDVNTAVIMKVISNLVDIMMGIDVAPDGVQNCTNEPTEFTDSNESSSDESGDNLDTTFWDEYKAVFPIAYAYRTHPSSKVSDYSTDKICKAIETYERCHGVIDRDKVKFIEDIPYDTVIYAVRFANVVIHTKRLIDCHFDSFGTPLADAYMSSPRAHTKLNPFLLATAIHLCEKATAYNVGIKEICDYFGICYDTLNQAKRHAIKTQWKNQNG